MPPIEPARAVTKTELLAYLTCPEEAWLARHEPLDVPPSPLQRLAREDGEQVDALAREYLSRPGVAEALFGCAGRVSFQENFELPGRWSCRTDVVFRPSSGGPATLVEVKASTLKRHADGRPKPAKDHLLDLAFQRLVLTASGCEVVGCGLLLLAPDYRLGGEEVDLEQLFAYVDVTAELAARVRDWGESPAERVGRAAVEAPSFLNGPEPPAWDYTACANKADCRWLQRHVELPPRHVFAIPRIGGKKLAALLENRILCVDDVPDYADLTTAQRRMVAVTQGRVRHCDQTGVRRRLRGLRYPLYFLDYETVSPALPAVSGMGPYERLAFQFSLHIRHAPGEDCEHHEHLLHDCAQGCAPLLRYLSDYVGGEGSVIVWNKSFEHSVNESMAATWPEYAPMLRDLNDRMFDLMDVFRDECVEDYRFGGSYSIKAVLPALVPDVERGYTELEIGDGESASYTWWRLARGGFDERDASAVRADLREYCALDTLAMVRLLDWAEGDPSATHPYVEF